MWIVIGSSVFFAVFRFSVWVVITKPNSVLELEENGSSDSSLSFSKHPNMVCTLQGFDSFEAAPSLESFVKALSTEGDRDLTFSGLAIVSKLANACQSLVDVGKARSSSQQNCAYRDKGGFCHNMFVVRANSKSAAHWILYDDIFFQSMAAREKL